MKRYRLEVGHQHGIQPKNVIGAIANEAGLESQYIGKLIINQDHSIIDLPDGMPKEIFQHLKKVHVCGHKLGISPESGGKDGKGEKPRSKKASEKRGHKSDKRKGDSKKRPKKRTKRTKD